MKKYLPQITLSIGVGLFLWWFLYRRKDETVGVNMPVGLPMPKSYYEGVVTELKTYLQGITENEQGVYDIIMQHTEEEVKAIYVLFGKVTSWDWLSTTTGQSMNLRGWIVAFCSDFEFYDEMLLKLDNSIV